MGNNSLKPPPKEYAAPGYVGAFMIAGLLCVVGGVFSVIAAISDGHFPWAAVGLIIAGLVNFLYASMADALGRSAWRIERLAYDLLPVIDEANEQAERRLQLERDKVKAQEAEIRRAVTARHLAEQRAREG